MWRRRSLNFSRRSMLVIRWRRSLTDQFVSRWLAHHNHYRDQPCRRPKPTTRISASPKTSIVLSMAARTVPVPRMASTIFRILVDLPDGLVARFLRRCAVGLSKSFTLPGTDIVLPGLLFWVALLYAGLGTLITSPDRAPAHRAVFPASGASKTDFRFSLARLREYTEQVALLNSEDTEQNMAAAALSGTHRQLSRPGLSPYARHGDLRTLFRQISPIHSLSLHSAAFYFRPQNRAWCDDANRSARSGTSPRRADLFRQLLHLPRGFKMPWLTV